MTDDTRFDEMIARAARELDAPAEPPRDAMWAAIQDARSAARAEDVIPIASAPPATARSLSPASAPALSRAGSTPWLRYGAALAAMLVVGIGIGRITSGMRGTGIDRQAAADARSADSAERSAQTANARTADAPADAPSADGLSAGAPAPDALRGALPGDLGQTTTDPRLAAIDRPPVTRVAPADGGPALARANRPAASSGEVVREGSSTRTYDTMLPYRIVARRHLERVQTLLVSLPTDVRDGRINDVAVRAADLLVSTRLLLDTPAAEDPRVRTLLDDVELILAQAATISPTRSADDVEIIQNAINQRDVLLRLHAATAGSRLSGT